MHKGKASSQIYFDEFRFEDTAVLKTKFALLAGYDYGKELWEEYCSQLNYYKPFKIVLPNHLQGMSISFIDGLFAEMIENIGVDKILERMTMIHPDEEFIKHVMDDIAMYK